MQSHRSKTGLSPRAISAVHQGNKIEAIKLVRKESGIGLKEAKDLVDRYLINNPAVEASYSTGQARSGPKGSWWLFIVIVGAVLLYAVLADQQ